MKIRSICTAVALSASASMAWAGTYQAEVGVGYVQADVGDDVGDADALSLIGEWHFKPVNTEGHPLAEAAFLEQSSSLTLSHTMSEFGPAEIDGTSLNLGYYVPDTMFYVGANFVRASYDFGFESGSENDWGVTLGLTPVEGLLVTTNYMNEPGYDFNLSAKYVRKLEGETAINIDASFVDGDIDDALQLAVDYYFNKSVSLGVALSDAAETGYGVRGQVFVTEQFSLGVQYFDVDEASTTMVVAGLRF